MSCGLSGLEVSERKPAYVAILQKKGYSEWGIVIPPIRGRYDDYGYLRVDETELELARLFGVVMDDNHVWEPLDQPSYDENKETLPFWMDATAFEALGGLVRDYAEKKDGTVADDLDHYITTKIEPGVAKALDMRTKYADLDATLNDFWTFELSSVFGYGEDILIAAKDKVKAIIEADQPLDTFMEGFRRCYLLECGSMELRKPLIGQNGAHGPQHGGERALVGFYETILAEGLRRKAEADAQRAEYE